MDAIKKLLLFAFLFFLGYPTFSQNEKDYSEAKHLIEVWLESQKDFDKLPGITALVMDDQEIIWSGAYGMANVEEQIKTEPTSLFSICSISKLFTSVAIMKLYDEGKLRLDDKIEDLLPWYNLQQKYAESGPITVRALLTHSAGLPRESKHAYWSGPDFPFPTSGEIKKELGSQETLYPASTYFQYSNLGMALLGEIVTEISGMPYEKYIQENILKPLELNDTRPFMPKDLHGKELTIGYSSMLREGDRATMPFFQANGINAAAGFSSNVVDLSKFAAWQFRLLDTTATEILKPSTLNYMQRVHWTDPDWNLTWGLGFSVFKGSNGNTMVGHGGSCPGYRSTLRLDPKNKRAYVVMINASGTNPNKYANGIAKILEKAPSEKKEEKTDGVKINLNDYAGYYDMQPWWSEVYFAPFNGKLVSMSLPTDDPANSMTFYKHIEGDTFRRVRDDDTLGETLVFKRNTEGKVVEAERFDNNYMKKLR